MRMRTHVALLTVWAVLLSSLADAQDWVEGKNYYPVVPAQHTSVPAGKIEVAEIFSYACPYCAQFNPLMQQLRKSLPANAQLVFIPASFNPSEDWPMFQQATCAAQTLGIFDQTHDRMFDAVWKTGELAIADPKTHVLKSPLPTLEDVAHYYSKLTSVDTQKFLATARSFSVGVQMNRDDALLKAYHVDGTPTLIVNGKYRVSVQSAGGNMKQMIDIALWLVAKESK
jgi:protein dithiol oxidoreductase (disulfide-forming)